MWMGELITQRGIGNGMSILIFTSVVSSYPSTVSRVRAEAGNTAMIALLVLFVVLTVAIVFVEQGQRRIPVQFAKRVVGRRMYGGQSTYIPLKVNQSGVIPIIFASSVLYLPLAAVERAARRRLGRDVQKWINDHLRAADQPVLHRALRPADHRVRVLLHGDHLRPGPAGGHHPQAGRLHPRHPAGPQTERYLAKILNRITLPGALFIAARGPAAVHPADASAARAERRHLLLLRDVRADRRRASPWRP